MNLRKRGQNCVSYVAYRLSLVGATSFLSSGLGSGGEWDDSARIWNANHPAQQIAIDGSPAAGAVAEWERGHVAYVDYFGSDAQGYFILTSESGYTDGEESRQVYRPNQPGWPDHFIHVKDLGAQGGGSPAATPVSLSGPVSAVVTSGGLRAYGSVSGSLTEVARNGAGVWTSGNTLVPVSGALSMTSSRNAWGTGLVIEGGLIYHVWADGTGWHKGSTGLPASGTLSAVDMGKTWPQALLVEGGVLYHVWGDTAGWHKASTGLGVTGQVSAVNMGGSWPQALVSEGGVLYQVWGDTGGWHKASTALSVSGQPSAVNMGGSWPAAVVAEGGTLQHIWADTSGWHKASTGLAASGQVSAANAGGGWPTVLSSQGGVLYIMWGDSTGWHKSAVS